jgi:very-short-patch-repair endonuclease
MGVADLYFDPFHHAIKRGQNLMARNFPNWDMGKVESLKAAGRIAGYAVADKPKTEQGKLVAKHFKKRSKEKESIAWALFTFCQENALKLYEEYVFDKTGQKGYRFDYCIPELNLAIEYEGIFANKSGHTTIAGYSKDVQKYNLATEQGWRLIRLTAMDYQTLKTKLTYYHEQKDKLEGGHPRTV